MAFSGWVDPYQAIQESSGLFNKLPCNKWISLGGGNSKGRFSSSSLSTINNAINSGSFKAYSGIVFDSEEGDSGLSSAFATCFRSAKSKGLDVLVTVSHSAPYGIADGGSLMRSFFSNPDIHYLSPQLYTSGYEGGNDYSTVMGVQFSEYKTAKADVIPSIVKSSYYADAERYFASQGVTTHGYIQWSQ